MTESVRPRPVSASLARKAGHLPRGAGPIAGQHLAGHRRWCAMGHPVAFLIGFARLADELVIHGSTGSPWLRALSEAPRPRGVGDHAGRGGGGAGLSRRSATRRRCCSAASSRSRDRKAAYLNALTDTFLSPAGVAELRPSTRKNWWPAWRCGCRSARTTGRSGVSVGWPGRDAESDIEAGGCRRFRYAQPWGRRSRHLIATPPSRCPTRCGDDRDGSKRRCP